MDSKELTQNTEESTPNQDKKELNNNDWLEAKVSSLISQLSLERVKKISEQIDNHYVASIIYKDLERNLTEREKLIDEFKKKLTVSKETAESFLKDKSGLSDKVVKLVNKQKECLKEYQNGVQELEEEVADIDKQIKSLEEQIAELQRRKSEIAEQQEIRLKEQDATQLELQSEIDNLEKEQLSLDKQHQDLEEQIKTMTPPNEITVLESRIEDLIHHICSIFETSTPTNIASLEKVESTEKTEDIEKTEKPSQGENTPPIFQLNPWAAEENQGLTRISMPVGVKQVILSLHMPGDKIFERYSAELYSSNGRRVWNSDKLEVNGHAVVITFNSTFFLSDDYEMRLRGRNSERNYTPIAEYYFHVNKK